MILQNIEIEDPVDSGLERIRKNKTVCQVSQACCFEYFWGLCEIEK